MDFGDQYHLHIIHMDDEELEPKWEEFAAEHDYWLTSWTPQTTEQDVVASFGTKALEITRSLDSLTLANFIMCLTVYLEGGVSISNTHTATSEELLRYIKGEGDNTCSDSKGRIISIRAKQEKSEEIKKMIYTLIPNIGDQIYD